MTAGETPSGQSVVMFGEVRGGGRRIPQLTRSAAFFPSCLLHRLGIPIPSRHTSLFGPRKAGNASVFRSPSIKIEDK